MSKSKQIEVVIDRAGVATIEVDGIQGPSCSIHTGALIRALGGEVVEDTKKPAFYQATSEENKEKTNTGW